MTVKRELLCEVCDRDYEVWAAPDDVWNRVMRGGYRGAADRFDFVCPSCFMVEARSALPAHAVWWVTPMA